MVKETTYTGPSIPPASCQRGCLNRRVSRGRPKIRPNVSRIEPNAKIPNVAQIFLHRVVQVNPLRQKAPYQQEQLTEKSITASYIISTTREQQIVFNCFKSHNSSINQNIVAILATINP